MRILIFFCFISVYTYGQVTSWQSPVIAENTCRYFEGTQEPPSDWYEKDFSDNNWKQGPGGIGYGDNDDGTTTAEIQSVYLRYSFAIADKDEVTQAILSADYDDGFIAYLNGTEIFRGNINITRPRWNDLANEAHEANLHLGQLPEEFVFNDNQLNLLEEGENVLAFHVLNYINSSDLSSNFFLHFELSETNMSYAPTPEWFIPPIGDFITPLPIMKIEAGRFIPDEPKVPAVLSIINNDQGLLNNSTSTIYELETNIAIERRGQTSLFLFPKNGFGFETKDTEGMDMDTTILGLPSEEDWILHGPYSDKTLMRNVLAYDLSNQMNKYNSRTRYVELITDGEYQGIYVLMERIKRDKNRVDIAKLTTEDLSGDELTGGYVFKIDKDTPDWYSNYNIQDRAEFLAFQYVSPSRNNIQPEQEEYLQLYIDSFERALNAVDYSYGGKRYNEYIDLESFADHFLIKELAKDVDAYRISSYYYKDKDSKGGKIHAGPVWDFNIAFGNVNYCEGNTRSGWMYEVNCDAGIPFWWSRMMTDSEFRNVLQCRWKELSNTVLNQDNIFNKIDEYLAILEPAIERNFRKWPILDSYIWPNDAVRGSYEGEITALKQFIESRLYWMNLAIDDECQSVSTQEVNKLVLSCNPNPFLNRITIELHELISEPIEATLYSALGQRIYKEVLPPNELSHTIELGDISNGLYYLELKTKDRNWSQVLVK